MNLSEKQYNEIASYVDLKDVCFLIEHNRADYETYLLTEEGIEFIIDMFSLPTNISPTLNFEIDIWSGII